MDALPVGSANPDPAQLTPLTAARAVLAATWGFTLDSSSENWNGIDSESICHTQCRVADSAPRQTLPTHDPDHIRARSIEATVVCTGLGRTGGMAVAASTYWDRRQIALRPLFWRGAG
jgi:hypothetical protein